VLVLVLEGLVCGPVAYLRSLSEFRYASLIGVLAISYFVVLTVGLFAFGNHNKPVSSRWWNEVQSSSDVLRAWAIFISSYIVHNFIFPVSDGLANPTAGRMNKVLVRSTVIQVVTYTLVSIAGFVTFKQKTPQNLLMAFDTSSDFVIAGQCAMLVQLAVAHTMMYHPLRTYTWAFFRGSNAVLSKPMHVVITTLLIIPVTFISVVTPNIVPLMGIVGGFAGVTYAFTIPCGILVRLQGYEMQGPGSEWMAKKSSFYAGMTFLSLTAVSGYLSGILHIMDLAGVTT
jgi:sodium-coupled neutral amino acid transporter 11